MAIYGDGGGLSPSSGEGEMAEFLADVSGE